MPPLLEAEAGFETAGNSVAFGAMREQAGSNPSLTDGKLLQ